METFVIDNFIDLSYIVALFLAAQAEKKVDLFGKIIKYNFPDTYKVLFIGLIHAVIWIFWFHPENLKMWEHVKIILTSYAATVVFYNHLVQRFIKKKE